MNKSKYGIFAAGLFLSAFLFHSMFMEEIQIIEEKFLDGSPKRISVYEKLFGYQNKIRELEFWKTGKLRYDKQFDNNLPNGLQIFYTEFGGKITQNIKDGRRHGIYTERDPTGVIIKQEHWENGRNVKILIPIQKNQ